MASVGALPNDTVSQCLGLLMTNQSPPDEPVESETSWAGPPLPKKKKRKSKTPKSEQAAASVKASSSVPTAAEPKCSRKKKAKTAEPSKEEITGAIATYSWEDIETVMKDFDLNREEAELVLIDVCGPNPNKAEEETRDTGKKEADNKGESQDTPHADTASGKKKRKRLRSIPETEATPSEPTEPPAEAAAPPAGPLKRHHFKSPQAQCFQ